jgi:hypothetical protein
MESMLKPGNRFAFAGTSDRFANSAMRSDMPVNRQRQKSSLGKFSNGMWFIGQKVICVNDCFPIQILEWASNLPRKGRIYTICWIGPGSSIYTGERTFGFELEELPNGKFSFFAERFVPLVDKLAQACQRNALELTVCHPVPLPTHRQHCGPASRIPRCSASGVQECHVALRSGSRAAQEQETPR